MGFGYDVPRLNVEVASTSIDLQLFNLRRSEEKRYTWRHAKQSAQQQQLAARPILQLLLCTLVDRSAVCSLIHHGR